MDMRPAKLARALGISATTLRKYEEFGLLPRVRRTESGYRIYTDEHVAYLVCARRMLPGCSTGQIASMYADVMAGDTDAALWQANGLQADLGRERDIARNIARRLLGGQIATPTQHARYTVHALSLETGVPEGTIRHWDKVGLLHAERDRSSRYRLFSQDDIGRTLTLYALKLAGQTNRRKHSIEQMRAQMEAMDPDDTTGLTRMMQDIHGYLSRMNRARMEGIAALVALCAQRDSGQWIPAAQALRADTLDRGINVGGTASGGQLL